MGVLLDGRWTNDVKESREGTFDRKPTSFRRHISADSGFQAAPGRYDLYVSLACPWASRTPRMLPAQGESERHRSRRADDHLCSPHDCHRFG